jgi:YesN/AraC family two-component response regulator
MAKMDVKILKNLFKMVYCRDLDHYRYTARGRYRRLLERCPQVVQMLSLKDIASFLKISPIYLSKIRKEMTYETREEGKPIKKLNPEVCL